MKKLNNQGIGLVEAIIAIGFAVVLVVTLLGLTSFNAQNATNVASRQDAVTETSVQIERLKYKRDSNYIDFYSQISECTPNPDTNYPCTIDASSGDIRSCQINETSCFGATITTEPSEDLTVNPESTAFISNINIDLIAYYYVNKVKFSTATSTLLTNWRTRQ